MHSGQARLDGGMRILLVSICLLTGLTVWGCGRCGFRFC